MKKTRTEDGQRADPDRTVKLTWKDISEAELRALLAGAKSGSDPASSIKLIEYFYHRIHDNLPYEQTLLLEYLDHVFGGLVNGQPADRALGIERQARKD